MKNPNLKYAQIPSKSQFPNPKEGKIYNILIKQRENEQIGSIGIWNFKRI